MDAREQIDIGFDFRTDTPEGKDPDKRSPTLRKYHRLLWSKPLPSGVMFDLDDTTRGEYLHHKSELGEFFLTSDAVVASFRYVPMVQDEPEQLEEFMHIGYTMGGMMLWPGNRVDGKMTITRLRRSQQPRKQSVPPKASSAAAGASAAPPVSPGRPPAGEAGSCR